MKDHIKHGYSDIWLSATEQYPSLGPGNLSYPQKFTTMVLFSSCHATFVMTKPLLK